MTVLIALPDREPITVRQLVLDANGTLTNRGRLVDGVAERIAELRRELEVIVASADTFGVTARLAADLGVESLIVDDGAEKAALIARLGPAACAAIGNGANDVAMLERAAVGIAVIGSEGASGRALRAADIVCRSVVEALDLLLEPAAAVATLRS